MDVALLEDSTEFSVYVLDDSSPDGTFDVVRNFQKKLLPNNLSVEVLSRAKKEGLGKAYIWGFDFIKSLVNLPDYVLQMDADLSHDPLYLASFINAAKYARGDFIVGSRYISGGAIPKDWPPYRKFLSIYGNLFTKIMLNKELSDYTGGFNMFSISLIQKIDLEKLNFSGYGFLIVLKLEALRHKSKLVQIPIVFVDRTLGQSKMPLSTVFNNFLLVIKLRFFNNE
jgi:dolichol-phosphate mannosyltransferase